MCCLICFIWHCSRSCHGGYWRSDTHLASRYQQPSLSTKVSEGRRGNDMHLTVLSPPTAKAIKSIYTEAPFSLVRMNLNHSIFILISATQIEDKYVLLLWCHYLELHAEWDRSQLFNWSIQKAYSANTSFVERWRIKKKLAYTFTTIVNEYFVLWYENEWCINIV